MKGKRVPVATYRLQFNREFTFKHAQAILDYLKHLGISDCYASPVFRAGPQSTHGYDICCFAEINLDLGGIEGLARFSAAARDRSLGLLLDMVPNHMGSALTNEWWADVLKHGRASEYAQFFDIDWEPPTPGLRDKVLLPVLEDHYWKVLESGKLRVAEENGEFVIAYYDHKFPIAPESKGSLKHLHKLLQEQHYRLAHWRVGPHEINYRRFFDITELVSLRMEREEVFEATHKLLFDLIARGLVTGLRIDHPDGLWNPKQYFERLQQRGPVYVVAEKILTGEEPLPENWPVDGTTGYDFLNRLNGIFVDQANESLMTRIYQELTGCAQDFGEAVYASKKKVLDMMFQSEINALAFHLKALPQGQDFALPDLREAISEMAARFPVYRTYATESDDPDTHYVQAINENSPAGAFVRDVLSMKILDRAFVMKFQQLTGPVMAKGLEDTAFYNYNRLISLNEVGGNPGRFGTSVEEFHRYNVDKQKRWPNSLLATATHDTKRGEDLRARLNVLSEMPEQWREAVSKWMQPVAAPSANDQYLLYQTLVGAWDGRHEGFADRICAFMTKAMREAKANTTWTDPNEAYETATLDFIGRLLAPQNPWWSGFKAFQAPIDFFGRYNSLSQVLLKMTCPGVPDFYQGTELWDFNLVDPDNRRPVDYDHRRSLLAQAKRGPEETKLYVIWRALQLRNAEPELFQNGEYAPIAAVGPKREHVCAFARQWNGRRIIVVAPRLVYRLTNGELLLPTGSIWGDTRLETDVTRHTNVFTGESVNSNRMADILARFPIALLA